MSKLKIALISDIHYCNNAGNKQEAEITRLFKKFNKMVAKEAPDMIIDLGDRVSCNSHKSGKKSLEHIATLFNKTAIPKIHIIGNHDLFFITRADNERILNINSKSHSIDLKNIHIIAWNPNVTITDTRRIKIDPDELLWLENDLLKTEKPTLVLSHIPLDHIGTKTQDRPNKRNDDYYCKYYAESSEIQRILQNSGKNFLNIAGDHHVANISFIDKVAYITMPSFVQDSANGKTLHSAFGLLEIDGNQIKLKISGQDKIKYNIESDIIKKLSTKTRKLKL